MRLARSDTEGLHGKRYFSAFSQGERRSLFRDSGRHRHHTAYAGERVFAQRPALRGRGHLRHRGNALRHYSYRRALHVHTEENSSSCEPHHSRDMGRAYNPHQIRVGDTLYLRHLLSAEYPHLASRDRMRDRHPLRPLYPVSGIRIMTGKRNEGGGAMKKAKPKKTSRIKKGAKKAAPKAVSKRIPSPPGKKRTSDAAALARAEIIRLMESLTAEDLGTLLEYARIMLHNRRVLGEYLQHAAERAAQIAKEEPRADAIHVKEGEDGSYFVITFSGYRHFFADWEMEKILGICREAADPDDAARRLYAWFEKDRSDVKKNAGLSGPREPVLRDLYLYLAAKYGLKG